MKREIKFRAWDPEKGMFNAYGFNEKFVFKYDLNSPEPMENIFPIKECVLMQFTGLKDKNGIEIYEGDLLDFEGHGNHLVCFKKGAFGYLGFYDFVSLLESNLSISKVIGNIHENPELLC